MKLGHAAGRQRADGASRRRSSSRPARSAALLRPRPFRARPARGPRRAIRRHALADLARRRLRASARRPAGRLSGPSAHRPRDRPPGAAAATSRCSRSSTTTCRSCSIRPSPRSSMQGYEPLLVAHPILAVGARCDPAPSRRLFGEATRPRPSAGAARKLHPYPSRPHRRRRRRASASPRALRRVYADVAVAVRRLGRHARPHRRGDRRTIARTRRRCRPTRSPRRSPSSNGSPTTTSPSSACANTASRRATRPPIRSRGPGSASCAIPPCGSCAAARISSS